MPAHRWISRSAGAADAQGDRPEGQGGGGGSPTPTPSGSPSCTPGYTTATTTGTLNAGGTDIGNHCDECATEIYNEWAACQHFLLYDDVAPVLQELAGRGLKIGLISNSHRCLASFQEHFQLRGLITAAVSSSEHGYMKPHPSIFEAALTLAGVDARESLMVGDSVAHDIDGARRVGMRGVLVHRSDDPAPVTGVPVIRSMAELPALIN